MINGRLVRVVGGGVVAGRAVVAGRCVTVVGALVVEADVEGATAVGAAVARVVGADVDGARVVGADVDGAVVAGRRMVVDEPTTGTFPRTVGSDGSAPTTVRPSSGLERSRVKPTTRRLAAIRAMTTTKSASMRETPPTPSGCQG